MFKAVLVGLGQVAWRFDDEPGRTVIATHLGAYRAVADRIELAGAFDPSEAARSDFAARHPEVPLFDDIGEMMRACEPEVVSVCSPNDAHRDAVETIFAIRAPRILWCEKPLATSVEDAEAIAELCVRNKTELLVSYVREWHPLWQRFKERMDSGEIGEITCLRVAMPNRLWSIGSHAVSLLRWLGGEITSMRGLPVPALTQHGEPAVSGLFLYSSGASGILQVTSRRNDLVVEAEAIGTEGRLICREGTGSISTEMFAESARFSGYRELSLPAVETIETPSTHSPFIVIAREIADRLEGKSHEEEDGAAAALQVQVLLEQLAGTVREPAEPGGAPV